MMSGVNLTEHKARRLSACLGIAAAGFLVAGCQTGGPVNVNTALVEPEVRRVLDELHDAAARADESAYFALYAPDAVFLGTDATERWTLDQFKAYARPIFAAGHGWSYTSTERHIGFGPGGRTAWFDERLHNAKLGECRGSGVLVQGADARWRIAQYNLTIPIPNDLAEEVAQSIRTRNVRP